MMRRHVRPIANAGFALAFATGLGCTNDSTGPDRFAGTYDLVRYEGVPLPAVLSRSSSTSVSLVTQRLLLGDAGTGVMATSVLEVNARTLLGSPLSYSSGLTYVLVGGKIAITFVCPPTADCVAGPHLVGERTGDDLTLAPPTSSKPASVYARAR